MKRKLYKKGGAINEETPTDNINVEPMKNEPMKNEPMKNEPTNNEPKKYVDPTGKEWCDELQKNLSDKFKNFANNALGNQDKIIVPNANPEQNAEQKGGRSHTHKHCHSKHCHSKHRKHCHSTHTHSKHCHSKHKHSKHKHSKRKHSKRKHSKRKHSKRKNSKRKTQKR